MEKLRVRLVGGVGNQLFGYYAGASLAGKLGLKLAVDLSWTHSKITSHASSIASFELPGIEAPSEENRPLNRLLFAPGIRTLDRISHHFQPLKSLRRIGDYSEQNGWIPEIFDSNPPRILWGYFQSWRYIEFANQFGYPLRPSLVTTSNRLDDLISQAHREHPISVHVRQGDYLSVSNFGVLRKNYYDQAIRILRSRGYSGPVWLFSDSLEKAREFIKADYLVRDVSAVEQLYLMSVCRAHVIANSSYSWWGAWLDSKNGDVIAPKPWFKHGPKIRDLLPPHWTTISTE
jgi:hypothetical protein